MALSEVWIASPCYHSRGGVRPRLLVIHTAEGARTIEDLGHFFANAGNQVSSHAGADDKRGKIGAYVYEDYAAWTQAYYNEEALSLELCGFASWSRSTWLNEHENMLRNCADWIAQEGKQWGIPIKELTPSQAQGSTEGTCQHIDLGSGGGSHVDCGSGFPIDKVLEWAKGGGGGGSSQAAEESMAVIWLKKGMEATTVVAVPPGASRFRACSNNNATLRIDFLGSDAASNTMTPSYDNVPDWKIPDGVRGMVVHRKDDGTNEVSMSFGA